MAKYTRRLYVKVTYEKIKKRSMSNIT